MHKAEVAEWILSCAIPADRAAAAAGDLAEEDHWFWFTLIQMTAAATVDNLVRTPIRYALCAGLLWLPFLLAWLLYTTFALLAWAILYFINDHTGLELLSEALGYRVQMVPTGPLASWIGLSLLPALVAWKMGRDMSRKTPGAEFALWVAVTVAWTVLGDWVRVPIGMLPLMAFLAGLLRARWLSMRARYPAS